LLGGERRKLDTFFILSAGPSCQRS
jgi:hypothetical protein